MGFTTGFIGGITVTYTLAYLSLYIHRSNRIYQSTLLSQQKDLLRTLYEPPEAEPLEPVYEVRKAGLTEQFKDKWNREIETGVRSLAETDWEEVRIRWEKRLGNVWGQVKESEAGEQAKAASDSVVAAAGDAKARTQEALKDASAKSKQLAQDAEKKARELGREADKKTREVAQNVADKTAQLAKDADKKTRQLAQDTKDKSAQLARDARDTAQDLARETKDQSIYAKDRLVREAGEVKDQVVLKAGEVKDQIVKGATSAKDEVVRKAEELRGDARDMKRQAVVSGKEAFGQKRLLEL